ncbi:hypothetical protein [Streptomyces niveus]|uniref:hypothetical protein n=1 Tax=Streptomyces niveus TaxID=193462 RepID=UPI0034427B72
MRERLRDSSIEFLRLGRRILGLSDDYRLAPDGVAQELLQSQFVESFTALEETLDVVSVEGGEDVRTTASVAHMDVSALQRAADGASEDHYAEARVKAIEALADFRDVASQAFRKSGSPP